MTLDAKDSVLGRLRARWPRLTELVLFCAVGASGVAVDYAVFVPLIHLAGLDPRLAAVFSFAVAVSWNYALNRRITFERGAEAPLPRSYLAFVAVCAVGVGVRVAVMHLLMVGPGWRHPPEIYLTSFVGIVAATAVNFLGARFIAFRAPGD
ncbi:MAG: GtrA family protein [Polyangia bacterium]|nr:GtrA family protein [Polyangia bacterium]